MRYALSRIKRTRFIFKELKVRRISSQSCDVILHIGSNEIWRPLVQNSVSILVFSLNHHTFFKFGPSLCAQTCLSLRMLQAVLRRVFIISFCQLSMNMYHEIVIYLL
jgi:hypothetical protein